MSSRGWVYEDLHQFVTIYGPGGSDGTQAADFHKTGIVTLTLPQHVFAEGAITMLSVADA